MIVAYLACAYMVNDEFAFPRMFGLAVQLSLIRLSVSPVTPYSPWLHHAYEAVRLITYSSAHTIAHIFVARYHAVHLYGGIAWLVILPAAIAHGYFVVQKRLRGHVHHRRLHYLFFVLIYGTLLLHARRWYTVILIVVPVLKRIKICACNRYELQPVSHAVYDCLDGRTSVLYVRAKFYAEEFFDREPGDFVRVSFRSRFSRFYDSSHHLTVVGDCMDNTGLSFLIRVHGDWTSRLRDALELRDCTLIVEGPFKPRLTYSPSTRFCPEPCVKPLSVYNATTCAITLDERNRYHVLISTGTAIASHLAFLDTEFHRVYVRSSTRDPVQICYLVIWSVRTLADVHFALTYFDRYAKKSSYFAETFEFLIFVTRDERTDVSNTRAVHEAVSRLFGFDERLTLTKRDRMSTFRLHHKRRRICTTIVGSRIDVPYVEKTYFDNCDSDYVDVRVRIASSSSSFVNAWTSVLQSRNFSTIIECSY